MTCQSRVDDSSADPIFQEMLDALQSIVEESYRVSVIAIVQTNYHIGRMARSLGAGHYVSPVDYARGVAGHYRLWQPIVETLQGCPDDPAWQALYDRLYQAGRARLRRNTSYLIDNPDEMAANCAGDALFHIYHDRFPYDCNFHAWAYAILNIICRRMLHYLGSDSDLIHHCCMSIDTLDEYGLPPDDAAGPERVVGWLWDLERATEQLSTPNRRTFARLYYLEGKNYSQIAREMGKNIGALYKLNNDTLADYRRQLA